MACCRYRRPPWMSFVEALEVAEPKSPASTRTVFKPRSCASKAQPAPEAPPPITQRSYEVAPILLTISDLCCILLTRDAVGVARCSPAHESTSFDHRRTTFRTAPSEKTAFGARAMRQVPGQMSG